MRAPFHQFQCPSAPCVLGPGQTSVVRGENDSGKWDFFHKSLLLVAKLHYKFNTDSKAPGRYKPRRHTHRPLSQSLTGKEPKKYKRMTECTDPGLKATTKALHSHTIYVYIHTYIYIYSIYI